ncbi:hypothetical protein CJI53_06705 [Bifidobacteriaceae bacterium VN002]|nr:hypothetical protein CJI53_06705 [Bifidobacteriaceae bacterium VN002]
MIRHFLLLEYAPVQFAALEPILLSYYMQPQCQTLSFFCMSPLKKTKIKCEKIPIFGDFTAKSAIIVRIANVCVMSANKHMKIHICHVAHILALRIF